MKIIRNILFFMFIVLSFLLMTSCVFMDNTVKEQELIKLEELPDENASSNLQNLKEPVEEEIGEEPMSSEEIEELNKEEADITVKNILDNMTLEEKIGQMFIVTPEVFSNGVNVTSGSQLNSDKIEQYNIGGLVFFSKNIETPEQITLLTEYLKDMNEEYPMFISIDEEGGQVARISNNSNFPDKRIEDMSVVGEAGDFQRAYEIGDTIGAYLNKYGFNLDFAPVCDVLLNNANMVVRKRSFSSDANIVSQMSENVMFGLENNNILTAAKHFPGHGNTALDTHDGFATNNATLEEMKENELLPFENMIKNSVDFMMVSHVIYPNLSEESVPATMNYDIVTGLLKNEMNYQGVIITDGMNMGAISNNYSVEQSTKKAIIAGIDIILMPSDFYVAYNAVLDSVNSGEISEERIDESVFKILKLKQGLN